MLTLTEANLAENLGTHPYEWDVLGLAIKRCNANVIVKTPFTPGVAPSREMRRLQANRATQLNDLLRGPLVKAADAAGISATTRREMSRALLYPGAIAYFSALMSQVRDGDLPQNDGVAALERAFLLSGIDREKTVAVREFIQWFFEQSSGRTMANLSPEDAERFRQALDVLASMQLIHVLDGAVSWESPLVMNAIKIRSEWREGILAALENVIAAAE